MNIPMYLTSLRIVLIPVFIVVFYLPFHSCRYVAAFIFVLAGFTDWLDGHLARRFGQESVLGAFLDPVADKLLVAVALVLLVSDTNLPFISLPSAIIVSREIAISALREWMAEIGKRTSVAVSFVGKIKTTMQMLAITILLASNPQLPASLRFLGYLLLYTAAGLTLWTMVMYIRAAWPNMIFEKTLRNTQ